MSTDTAIVWLRRALRLADNPALAAALERHAAVTVAYVHDTSGRWTHGSAARAWLTHSLAALDADLRSRGSRLLVLEGPATDALPTLASALSARVVHHDRSYVPEIAGADARVAAALAAAGVSLIAQECAYLRTPETPRTGSDTPYTVFTPYYNACRRQPVAHAPLPAPAALQLPDGLPTAIPLASIADGTPAPPRLLDYFTPGEAGAAAALERFVAETLGDYASGRDRPNLVGTSRLSPHLAFGEIAPWRVAELAEEASASIAPGASAEAFVRQLHWRKFGGYLLHHFPHTATQPLKAEFAAMPWAEDLAGRDAWRAGQTGFPLVDAGMRELAATGWMHNRVRMLAASFLTKDLLLPWQDGERFFWESLVDADPGNNTLGWQWVAGSGADAAPYFRVFNPITQGERFDPDGAYMRAWVPELAQLPARWIHRPHEAPPEVLDAAGVVLGETYPRPILDHAEARRRALAAYDAVRAAKR